MSYNNEMKFRHAVSLLFLCLTLAHVPCFAQYNAALLSVSITNGTPVAPRSTFTQTWTFTNNGTVTWAAGNDGCTLDLTNADCLGAMPLITNTDGSVNGTYTYHFPRAVINSHASVAPNGTASYSMKFIAPEATGSYTDYFELNGTNWFGPIVTAQITVSGGNTNVFDRSRAISFANNYANYFCPDGYFWTNGSDYAITNAKIFALAPVGAGLDGGVGDDCAHFVSCCIGSTNVPGGGLKIPMRTPTYGEPGASRLITTCLLAPGYAVEVPSLSQLEPGDVIGWTWAANDTNLADIGHVTLYMGNNLVTCHAVCALDVGANTFFGTSGWTRHLIHILDYPTLWTTKSGSQTKFMWTTNWNKYALYSASSLSGPWNKVSGSPTKTGVTNSMTETMPSSGNVYYRLEMP